MRSAIQLLAIGVLLMLLAAPALGQSAIGILSEKENRVTLEAIEREQAHLVSLPLPSFKARSFGWLRLTPSENGTTLTVAEQERILEVAAKKAEVERTDAGWKVTAKKPPRRLKVFFEPDEKRRSVACDLAELPESDDAHFGVFFVVGGYYCLMHSPEA